MTIRTSLALDDLDDDPLRAVDVPEPEQTLERIDLADKLSAERLHAGKAASRSSTAKAT